MGRTAHRSNARCSIVRLASRLVPARLRDDWRREWEGELAAAAEQSASCRSCGTRSDRSSMRSGSASATSPICRPIDDLRHGFRQLRQQAAFAITTVGILALSMAATVTAFSVVSQILLRPLPYPDPDRIVTVWERLPPTPGRNDVAPGNFIDWRARATSFTHLAAVDPYSYDYTGGDRPEVLKAIKVTEGFFDVFGITPLARPVLQARRTQSRQRPRRRVERALLARAFRQRSVDRRQDHSARRWGVSGRGHRAGRLPAPPAGIRARRSRRLHREDDRGVRAAHPRQRLLERRRPAEGRRLDRAGAGRDGRDLQRRSKPRTRAPTRTCAPRSSRCASIWSATCGRRSRCSAARCWRCC